MVLLNLSGFVGTWKHLSAKSCVPFSAGAHRPYLEGGGMKPESGRSTRIDIEN